MEKVVRKFSSFEEADEEDARFYASLTPDERMDIMLDLLRYRGTEDPPEGLDRVYRSVKFPPD